MTGAESVFQSKSLFSEDRTAPQDETWLNKVHREVDLLRDGLSSGAANRFDEAKENKLTTGLEFAGSVGIGAGITKLLMMGGSYSTVGKVGVGLLLTAGAYDVARRAVPTWGAISDTWQSAENLDRNKQIVGHYAGSALFDYPLMAAGGAVGATSVSLVPSLRASFRSQSGPEPMLAFEPAVPRMDFGRTGRLGSQESMFDGISSARRTLDVANTQKFSTFEEMNAVMRARQLAQHPELSPVRSQMVELIKQADAISPKIAKDKAELSSLDLQLSALKNLTAENAALSQTQASLQGLKLEVAELPALRGQHAEILAQIKGKDRAMTVEAREQAAALKDRITAIEQRAKGMAELEAKVQAATAARDARQDVINNGPVPEIVALELQMQALRQRISGAEEQLAAVNLDLKGLSLQYATRSAELIPGVSPSTLLGAPEAAISKPKSVQRTAGERGSVKAADKSSERAPERAPDRASDRAPDRASDARRTPEMAALAERDMTLARDRAAKAVEDFNLTRKRHTTALKELNTFIEKGMSWSATAADAATANARSAQVLEGLGAMLKKVENWDRPAPWLKQHERADIMQRSGMNAQQVALYDRWYDSVRSPYQPRVGDTAEVQLRAIQTHLHNRVQVESVKNHLKTQTALNAAVDPILMEGFQSMKAGRTIDGKTIPEGSDLMVLVAKTIRDSAGGDRQLVLPFAKEGQHIQRFDMDKIAAGLRKQELMSERGPAAFRPDELYGFRLDHDPSRLIGSGTQVGYIIMAKPSGRTAQYGKEALGVYVDSSMVSRLPAEFVPGMRSDRLYDITRKLLQGGAK